MKINCGEIIKKMRRDMGISREELADRLYVSTRQLSRIETGEVDMDVWQFMSILELVGQPTEDFWLLYLESSEYEDYKAYKRIKRFLRDGHILKAKGDLFELEKKDLSKRPFINQFIAFAKVITDVEMLPQQALNDLSRAMSMSRPDFDESQISEYRLTYNEIYIITGISMKLSSMGEKNKAIALTESIIESREKARASEEDKAALFPALMLNLSTMLGKVGRYKESLRVCTQAIEICREYNNLRYVPGILYNTACSYRSMGEEEQIYKPYLVRAYHCAYAIGDNEEANIIKNDAESFFGIAIS